MLWIKYLFVFHTHIIKIIDRCPSRHILMKCWGMHGFSSWSICFPRVFIGGCWLFSSVNFRLTVSLGQCKPKLCLPVKQNLPLCIKKLTMTVLNSMLGGSLDIPFDKIAQKTFSEIPLIVSKFSSNEKSWYWWLMEIHHLDHHAMKKLITYTCIQPKLQLDAFCLGLNL